MVPDDHGESWQSAVTHIRAQIDTGAYRITQHAQQEMFADAITLDEVIEALRTGDILEDYPDHRRGACCLIGGRCGSGRFVHIVCTTRQPVVIIITVYEPTPPRWVTPTQRRVL